MPRACSCCAHAERAQIDELIAAGEAAPVIARRYGLSADSVLRHKASHVVTPTETEIPGEHVADPPAPIAAEPGELAAKPQGAAEPIDPVDGGYAGRDEAGRPLRFRVELDEDRWQRECRERRYAQAAARLPFEQAERERAQAEHLAYLERLAAADPTLPASVVALWAELRPLADQRAALDRRAVEIGRPLAGLRAELAELRRTGAAVDERTEARAGFLQKRIARIERDRAAAAGEASNVGQGVWDVLGRREAELLMPPDLPPGVDEDFRKRQARESELAARRAALTHLRAWVRATFGRRTSARWAPPDRDRATG